MNLKLLSLACILMLASCSPLILPREVRKEHRDEKKLEKILSAHPQWAKRDTVNHVDTTVISAVRADSVYVWQHSIDTFTIDHDRLHVQVIHNHDTVTVHGECAADTVIKTISIPSQTINVPAQHNFCSWWIIICCMLAMMIALLIYVITQRK